MLPMLLASRVKAGEDQSLVYKMSTERHYYLARFCCPHSKHGYIWSARKPCLCTSSVGKVRYRGGSGSVQFFSDRDVNENSKFAVSSIFSRNPARLRAQLQSYGVAGLLAYGVLNTVYYSGAFMVILFYFAKVPRGMGWAEACKQFVKVLGLTWAASQVTKVPRAALALFIAPVVDGSLIFVQARLRLRTRRNAFLVIVAICLLLVAAIFSVTLVAWA